MSYVEKLSDKQIKEVMEIYAPNFKEIEYTKEDGRIWVDVVSSEGYEEGYEITDYEVEVYDWVGKGDYLTRYRKKMLEWFGTDYAINYLL